MDTETAKNPLNPINYKETQEDRAAAKKELILNTLQTLSLEYLGEDATDFLNATFQDEILNYNIDEIQEELQDNGFFNVEIIYYYKAMDYLRENDISLSESVEIAAEYGYQLDTINSEILASLHASRERENKFYEFVAPELDKINN
jgi:hypothetical protein